MDQYTVKPIGILHSPFREKFGIPRQPNLAPHALATLALLPPYNHPACVEGLRDFSHLWLTFLFHATAEQGWQPSVRPPRLGGNATRGVFATRSMFRPNPIGLSVVELVDVVQKNQTLTLLLRGVDLLDGTPILDIKPYLPYADSLPQARADFAGHAPPLLPVHWRDNALRDADTLSLPPDIRTLIDEVLAQDPRPAYRQAQPDTHEYGVRLDNFNVRFVVTGDAVWVESVCRTPHTIPITPHQA